jgi:hypothetical protein
MNPGDPAECAMPVTRDPATARRRRRRLLAVWLIAVGGLGILLLVAQAARSPLDDADPSLQRPGFLDAFGRPTLAPAVTSGVPEPGRRAVVLFVRPALVVPLCRALGARPSLGRRAALAMVSPTPGGACPEAPVVADPGGSLGLSYRLRRPRDGGPPVGYAVVDSAGRVRYRTLDPSLINGLAEVETILRATP